MMKIPPPNYTQTPNDLFDHWLPFLGEIELKVLLVILRKTYGWHQEEDYISISQLEKYTGSTATNIGKAVKDLIGKGLVAKRIEGPKGSQKTFYSLVVQQERASITPSRDGSPPPPAAGAPPLPPREVQKKPLKETSKEKQQQQPAAPAAVPSKRSDNNKKPAAVHSEKRSNPMTALVYDCLADVDISDRDKAALSSKYSYDVVKQAVAALNRPGLIINSTTTRFLNWACLKGIGPDPKKEDFVEKNKALVAKLDGKLNRSKTVKIEVLNKAVEFVFLGSSRNPDVFAYNSASFGQHVSKAIDQYEFDIKMVK